MRMKTLGLVSMVVLSLAAAAALGQMGSDESNSLDNRLEATRQSYVIETPLVDPSVQPAQYSQNRRIRPGTGGLPLKKQAADAAATGKQGSAASKPNPQVDSPPVPESAQSPTATRLAPTQVPRRIKPQSTGTAKTPFQDADDTGRSSRRPALHDEDTDAKPISAAEPEQPAKSPAVDEKSILSASPPAVTENPPGPKQIESHPNESDNVSEPDLSTRPTEVPAQPAAAVLNADTKNRASDEVVISTKGPMIVLQTIGPRSTVIGRKTIYKVVVRNTGDVVADGVVVRIQGPNWAEIRAMHPTRGTTDRAVAQAGEPLAWQITQLPPRASEEVTLTVLPHKSDAFEMSVGWSIQPILAKTLIQVQEPKLHIQIDGPAEVRYGDTKIYRMTVSNPGTGEADNVQIQLMPLDGGDRPMAVQRIGKIAPGEKRELEVELTARQAGHLTIHAIATGEVGLKSEATERILIRRAGLKLDVKAPAAKFAGTLAAYQIRVSNPGNDVAQQVRMTATLPPGAEYVSSSHGGQLDSVNGEVTWSLSSLSAEESQLVSVKATLSRAGANTLQVNTQAESGLTDAASATTAVQALADLKLEVTDPRGPIPVGEEMVYEIRVINRGTKAAQDVEVIAFFSPGVEPVSVHGGGHQISAGQVVFHPIASVPVESEIVYKIVAKAVRAGDHIFRAEVRCQEIGTRLASEETTRFFAESDAASSQPANESTTIDAGPPSLPR